MLARCAYSTVDVCGNNANMHCLQHSVSLASQIMTVPLFGLLDDFVLLVFQKGIGTTNEWNWSHDGQV